MAKDKAYREAEKRISLALATQAKDLDLSGMGLTGVPDSLGQLTQLQTLNLDDNNLTSLPESLGQLTQLLTLDLDHNNLTSLPESLGQLTQLEILYLSHNNLASLPESLAKLTQLENLALEGNNLTSLPGSLGALRQLWNLDLDDNNLTSLPESLENLTQLRSLYLNHNKLTSLPESLGQLRLLGYLSLGVNPLNPELAAAYDQGTDVVLQYLRERAAGAVTLNEAKLILIGEGEVGKSCLLDALRADPWRPRKTTHGIEIKPVQVVHRDDDGKQIDITLNSWDFGGQEVYRPTHQLFFSAPAIYLVVWKPRGGTTQGEIDYWIKTIRNRAGAGAKILVVATHAGHGKRQADISLHGLQSKYGADTVLGVHHVDSKPDDETGERRGIDELKTAIAEVAAGLPGVGREVATSWTRVLDAVRKRSKEAPHISLAQFCELCAEHNVDNELAPMYAGMLNELGHVIHYAADDALRDIMILKPDWLAKAISFILDNETTRGRHGLVDHDFLSELWRNPPYEDEDGYPDTLHPLFRRLMERFDLSYQVVMRPSSHTPSATSLIAQLVPNARPELPDWRPEPDQGDRQQVQICRIVEKDSGQSAIAEGLFYRLIVRLHRYSLGRDDYDLSVHWQHGLMVADRYNGRALLEHLGNDVRITVRAAYPERFLHELTREIQWLVDDPDEGWAGLRCDVMVPCIEPCGLRKPGRGLFDIETLIAYRKRGHKEFLCPTSDCEQWHDIDSLLTNTPLAREQRLSAINTNDFRDVLTHVVRVELNKKDLKDEQRFLAMTADHRRMMSQVDEWFEAQLQLLMDEAKDGPRLFSIEPVKAKFFDRPDWISEKFRLTLWCEYSRLPLPAINGDGDEAGVYTLELTRKWMTRAAPILKGLATTLSLVLPVASSGVKLLMDDGAYDRVAKQLDFGQKFAESVLGGGKAVGAWLAEGDTRGRDGVIRADGSSLRELHTFLNDIDAGFGGLVRVQNKRREFLWVHPKYKQLY